MPTARVKASRKRSKKENGRYTSERAHESVYFRDTFGHSPKGRKHTERGVRAHTVKRKSRR
jgi:hypothetical protein